MSCDYHLEPRDGKTHLTLVNSGLLTDPSWDDTFHMMQNGWRFFLWKPEAPRRAAPRDAPEDDRRASLGDGHP